MGSTLVSTLALCLCEEAGSGGGGGWTALLTRLHSILSHLVTSGLLQVHVLRSGLARSLEVAFASVAAAEDGSRGPATSLSKGALLAMPVLLDLLAKEGSLGRTPFFPDALSPHLQGEEEEEGSPYCAVKQSMEV